MMDWIYERLNEFVESREMTEEEAGQEYREHKETLHKSSVSYFNLGIDN